MHRVGIVAGEASGDLIGTGLIKSLREKFPDIVFEGIAGPGMIAQGCHALYPAEKLSIFGLLEAFKHFLELHRIRKSLIQHFINDPPDIFIGIDAPDFNLGLEEALKQAGIKTVQYVSPQVWAWRRYRVKKVARAVNMMLALFPFEASFYKEHHVPVEYVGHHMADAIPLENPKAPARELLGLDADSITVAVLPGSRLSEARNLSQVFIDTMSLLHSHYDNIQFVVPLASPSIREIFESGLQAGQHMKICLLENHAREAMQAADVVMLASGTATLEALLLKRPMVVAYRFSWLSHFILKRFAKIEMFSLPNLLASEKLVPEFVQDAVTAETLAQQLMSYIDNHDKTAALLERFTDIHKQIRKDANQSAASAIEAMLTTQDES
jgi:lipid-A-disaccharide synthase